MSKGMPHQSHRKHDRACPRDKALMGHKHVGDATLDVCGKCSGQFFDSGEMFAAFGIKADPSYWDRTETGGSVEPSDLHCPNCEAFLLKQDVKYEEIAVEIDRCGKCGGLWLDKGEIDTLMKISEKLQPVLDAERVKAQEDLAKLGSNVDFSAPGLIARFLGMFKK